MKLGSHFCPDWDELLITPGTPEWQCCICNKEVKMKLKVKLAGDAAIAEAHPASDINRALFVAGYLLGFEKARELAVDLIENASYQRALRDMPKLGEEETE
jgi:hypothetical protein